MHAAVVDVVVAGLCSCGGPPVSRLSVVVVKGVVFHVVCVKVCVCVCVRALLVRW